MVMAGTAGVGESPQTVKPGSVTTTQVSLPTTLGYVTKDMLLLTDPGVSSCLVNQVGGSHVATDAGPDLPLGGTYYRDPSAFGADSIALQLGRDVDNPPQFLLFGVGANNTLYSYDLLKPTPADAAVTDGVVEMRAVYGLDTGNATSTLPDGIIDSWVDATGAYAAATLLNGSAASQANLRRIVAVRVGLILRTALAERSPSSNASGAVNAETFSQAAGAQLTLFADLPTALQKTRTLTTAERAYRFRTVDVTIPLRNVLMAPQV
jgi:type IV pilus assembly protein PilW